MDVAPLEAARVRLGLSVPDLWVDYFALGGTRDAAELGHYLRGTGPATTASDHDAIVVALNEALADHGGAGDLPYSSG